MRDPLCTHRHQPVGDVSSHPGPLPMDEPRALTTVCDRPLCIADAAQWVAEITGRRGRFYRLGDPAGREVPPPALSVYPPWSEWVADGLKPVENRAKLRTRYRGPVAIHASKTLDTAGFGFGTRVGCRLAPDDVVRGAFIAIATLTDVHWAGGDDCSCFDDQRAAVWAERDVWHWVVTGARRITPVVWRGRQGLWYAPDELAETLLAAGAAS